VAAEIFVSVLRTVDLYKSFGNLAVTKLVNLEIEPGERHVIIGPNGAGKTCLINQIGGQLRPSSGQIFVGEREITNLAPEQICRLGVSRTFQRNNLFRNLSAVENVRLAVQAMQPHSLNGFASAGSFAEDWERASEKLAKVGLAERADRPASSLSYGEQRQLEIAVALASNPSILLLDEPTSGMSPAETTEMTAMIAALPRSIAVVMIEHDMKVVFSIADRITVLYYGEVLATGRPRDISDNPKVRQAYLGQLPVE
jgi:branched-chain amino acid transport system ATP-binding protein